DRNVTGVQTCALPIFVDEARVVLNSERDQGEWVEIERPLQVGADAQTATRLRLGGRGRLGGAGSGRGAGSGDRRTRGRGCRGGQIGRASCRERVWRAE